VAAPALFALAADEIRPQTRLVHVEISAAARRIDIESLSDKDEELCTERRQVISLNLQTIQI
jgi:hypothetical protein